MFFNNKDTPAFRCLVLKECSKKWPKRTGEIRKIAEERLPLSADYKDKQLSAELLDDVILSYFIFGFSPDEYIYFRLENRTFNERREFISSRLKAKYHACFDNLLESSMFSKWNTYLIFKEYFKRDAIEIKNASDYPEFVAFVRRHPKYVKKGVDGMSGREVELVDSLGCGKSIKQQFEEMIKNQKFIVEELIIQSEDMARFNSSSVNTVRCITMNTEDGVKIPFGFFRIGVSGAFVDNAGAGGISCAIDMTNGVITTDGFNERAYCYQRHPDSETIFKGCILPEWKQLLLIAERAALKIPSIKTIGWDFAHTRNGWIIVEGNAMSSIEICQVSTQRGMRRDFEHYFRKMKPIIKEGTSIFL